MSSVRAGQHPPVHSERGASKDINSRLDRVCQQTTKIDCCRERWRSVEEERKLQTQQGSPESASNAGEQGRRRSDCRRRSLAGPIRKLSGERRDLLPFPCAAENAPERDVDLRTAFKQRTARQDLHPSALQAGIREGPAASISASVPCYR